MRVSVLIQPLSEDDRVSLVYAVPGNESKIFCVVMADRRGYKFACGIETGADELAISDTIVNFLNSKFMFLLMLDQAQTIKTTDGCIGRSLGQV